MISIDNFICDGVEIMVYKVGNYYFVVWEEGLVCCDSVIIVNCNVNY